MMIVLLHPQPALPYPTHRLFPRVVEHGSSEIHPENPRHDAQPGLEKPPPLPGETDAASAPVVVPAPPSFGRQAAQLVVIPALIVAVAVGVALLFGKIAGTAETLDSQLARLRQSSGGGRMALGFQDPAYKDRCLAAYNIAQMIPNLKASDERLKTSQALIDTLDHYVEPSEDELQLYLLMAIGQLGQPGGLDVITARLQSDRSKVREGAIAGILAWPDVTQAKVALPTLTKLLADDSPMVREKAAAAVGALASPGDPTVIAALHQAMTFSGTGASSDVSDREVAWNAAVALARLGDPVGSQFVARVLLDRRALAAMPADDSSSDAQQPMSPAIQDRVILDTLAVAPGMTDPVVWDKIQEIADKDPNRAVQAAARQVLSQRKK